MAMSEGMGVMPVYNLDKGSNDMGMGGSGFIWILFLFVLLGFGGNGFGGNKQGEISNDFAYSNLNNSLGRIQDQNTYNTNTITQGLSNLGYTNLSNFKDLSSQMASCCCGIERNIDSVNFNLAKSTCDITTAIRADGEATRALINANTMQDLRDRLQAAELGLSQAAQTANIVSQVRPFPQPAYITCSPYSSPCGGCGTC